MTVYEDSIYKAYQLRGLPAGLFGETYIVATGIHVDANNHKLECFVMSQRPSPALYKAVFPVVTHDVSDEYLRVDFDFLVGEALQQAEFRIAERLSELAKEHGKPDIAFLPIEIKECHARPFMGCWMRGTFHPQITDLAQSTECASLATYLTSITKISYFRGPGR